MNSIETPLEAHYILHEQCPPQLHQGMPGAEADVEQFSWLAVWKFSKCQVLQTLIQAFQSGEGNAPKVCAYPLCPKPIFEILSVTLQKTQ